MTLSAALLVLLLGSVRAAEDSLPVDSLPGPTPLSDSLPRTAPAPAALPHNALLYVPEVLLPNIAFWEGIYQRIPMDRGLMHDADSVRVVYDTLLLNGATGRGRTRRVRERERALAYALNRMASTPREEWSEEMRGFETVWGRELTPEELYNASQRVRFQLGQRDNFVRGLGRSGRYLGRILEVFRARGLPEELAYLPHVESSFNYKAYSKAGAAGIWQFIRSTGKMYMKVGYDVDERLDPVKSTAAAASLLRGNYEALQSWPLAVTAYNHGRASMERAVRELGTTDIGVIVANYKSRGFSFASKNFYAEFVAAYRTARDYRAFFGDVTIDAPMAFTEMPLEKHYRPSTLTSLFGVSLKTLEEYNMSLRPPVFRRDQFLPKGFALRLPPDFSRDTLAAQLARAPKEEAPEKLAPPTYYTVETGDNLTNISRRFGVPISTLFELNNLDPGGRIHPGLLLALPGGGLPAAAESGKKISPAIATAPSPAAAVAAARTLPSPAAPPLPDYLLSPQPLPGLDYEQAIDSMGQVWEKLYPPLAGVWPVLEPPCLLCEFSGDFYELSVLDSNENEVQIRVQVDETVGHFADWAGLLSSDIRGLNRISSDIRLGQLLWVPLPPGRRPFFMSRRIEYHMGIEEDFFNNYVVAALDSSEIKAGTMAWNLALERDIPLWLLMKANNLRGSLRMTPKDKILVPVVEAKKT